MSQPICKNCGAVIEREQAYVITHGNNPDVEFCHHRELHLCVCALGDKIEDLECKVSDLERELKTDSPSIS